MLTTWDATNTLYRSFRVEILGMVLNLFKPAIVDKQVLGSNIKDVYEVHFIFLYHAQVLDSSWCAFECGKHQKLRTADFNQIGQSLAKHACLLFLPPLNYTTTTVMRVWLGFICGKHTTIIVTKTLLDKWIKRHVRNRLIKTSRRIVYNNIVTKTPPF